MTEEIVIHDKCPKCGSELCVSLHADNTILNVACIDQRHCGYGGSVSPLVVYESIARLARAERERDAAVRVACVFVEDLLGLCPDEQQRQDVIRALGEQADLRWGKYTLDTIDKANVVAAVYEYLADPDAAPTLAEMAAAGVDVSAVEEGEADGD